eukprot:scaffold76815_cov57-Phaeocystis_antarctica.AAC.1
MPPRLRRRSDIGGWSGLPHRKAARAPPPAQHGHVQRVPPQWEVAPWTRWKCWTEARAAARVVRNPTMASPLRDCWMTCRLRRGGAAGWVPPAGRGGWRCAPRRHRWSSCGAGARCRIAGAR